MNNTRRFGRAYRAFYNKCACCGKTDSLTVDHVVPKYWGGTLDYKQTLCYDCNVQKGALPIDYRTKTFVLTQSMLSISRKELRRFLKDPVKYTRENPKKCIPNHLSREWRKTAQDLCKQRKLASLPLIQTLTSSTEITLSYMRLELQ